MKRILLGLVLLVLLLPVKGQNSKGIHFFEGSLEEAAELAGKQHKKIFIDFYTSWCAPCKMMLNQVFPLPEVGEFFNRYFVCLKINAEKGEGRKIAARYQVKCFPTYIYLNPENMEILHRSTSNKPAARFIAEAGGALDPKLSSIYLTKAYESGKYTKEDLIHYIYYKKFSGTFDLTKEFAALIALGGRLTDRPVWETYRDCIDGIRNPYVMEVSKNYDRFVRLFGKEEVDAKLASTIRFGATPEFIEGLCDFEGKDYFLKVARLKFLFQQGKDAEAWPIAEQLLQDTALDHQKLLQELQFYTRIEPKFKDSRLTFDQLVHKLRCCRYLAYNWKDRKDLNLHYNYVLALEYLVRRSIEENRVIPEEFLENMEGGCKEYSLHYSSGR